MKKILLKISFILNITCILFCYDFSNFNSQQSIFGCIDPLAKNFNSLANKDDGSCIYELVFGCIDPLAKNFNSLANKDDGSCIYKLVFGCIDPIAKNFNSNANENDGSCVYNYYGCTHTLAENYDFKANIDDGSCIFHTSEKYDYNVKIKIFGCTDQNANNFNPNADINDGSCNYKFDIENEYLSKDKKNDLIDYDFNKNETEKSVYPKFKKIDFLLKNSVSNITFQIYSDNGELLESLVTDSYGKASFMLDLNKGLGIKIESSNNSYSLVLDKNNYIDWNSLNSRGLGEPYNLNIFSNVDLEFNVKVVDLFTKESVDNASFEINKIPFNVINKGSYYSLKISKDELINRKIQLGEDIPIIVSTLDINPTEQIYINLDLSSKREYVVSVSREITKKIQFIDLDNGVPLKNINVKVNGHLEDYFDKTDSNGYLYYNFFGEFISKQISFDIDVPYYKKTNNSYVLDPELSTHKVKIEPIYTYIKAVDSQTNDILKGLSFIYNDELINESINDDKYKLNFPYLDKDYKILIIDENNNYEETEFYLNISNGSNLKVETLNIHRITNIYFSVNDLDSKKLKDATIFINDEEVGQTNQKGNFNYQLKFTDKPIFIRCLKNGFIDEDYTLNLKPGRNTQDIILKTITYRLKCYDYNTNKNISGLKIDNDKIVNYEFDKKNKTYIIQFSEFGEYKLSVYDDDDFYQDSEILISAEKSNIMEQFDLGLYQKTFVILNVYDKNGKGINDVKILIKDELFGETMKSGRLRKRIKYSKPIEKIKFIVDKFYSKEKEIKLVPGDDNRYDVYLDDLPTVKLLLINKENGQKIENMVVQINDLDYESDKSGYIEFTPNFISQKFKVSFSDGEIDYFDKKMEFIFSDKELLYDFNLSRLPYIYLNLFDSSDSSYLSNVNVFVDGERKGKTQSNGKLKIKAIDNKEYSLSFSKDYYNQRIKNIKTNGSINELSINLDKLEQFIVVRNRMGEPLSNIKIEAEDFSFFTNEQGKAIISHKSLNIPVECNFISDKKYHEKLVNEYIFKKNNEQFDVILNTRPLRLKIQTIDNLSGKILSDEINGLIEVSPRPNSKSTFYIRNGTSDIDVFRSGDYKFIFNLIVDSQTIQLEQNISLDINNESLKKDIYINKPEIIFENKNVKNLILKNKNNNKEFNINDSKNIVLDEYGDYKLDYDIMSNLNISSKQRSINLTVNKNITNINLSIPDEYIYCFESKNKNDFDWQEICSDYINIEQTKPLEISKDLNYCEVLQWLAEDKYSSSEFKSSSDFYQKIITSVNECETNPDYNKAFTASLSKIRTRDLEFEEFDSWVKISDYWDDNGMISENFETYNRVCQIIGRNCEKGDLELRLTLLASIADLMYRSKIFA